MIVKKEHEFVSFPFPAGFVHLQLVAELALKDCGVEGGAEGEGDVWQPDFRLRNHHACCEGAKGNKG